ncbi:MAG: PilZ domain-containing protein [Magnetovibrio sp.]|nr:PilZ domain-containing protein [Magnetovibrio sp.]
MGKRRHPRIPRNEPASIEAGADTFDATVTDVSESGAAIGFSLPKGEARVRFDLGQPVNVESESLHD